MGCCASSGTTDRNKEFVSDNITEEETIVKEVLSETTFLTTSPTKSKIREEEEETEDNFKKPKPGMTRPDSIDPELGSEISEICSLSLSESVSSTVMMNGYDEEETKQRRKSPARSRTRVTGHNNNNNNYPTRRSDQSPRKRNTATCNGARSDESPGKRNSATCNGARSDQSPGKRNNATCNGARYGSGIRDPGERSGRRSRSPAMNRSVMDPNQSRVGGSRTCRKNAESPGRVRMDPNRTGLDHDGRGQQQHDNYGYTTEELLENPLVSLECFIFL
ncbi:unnamed protein product [Cochlearia groenlandica]